jgi:molybdopterin-guanine dinucleotide biosynthesis protein A
MSHNQAPSLPLYGLVLAGGHSRRMGQDKGAMALHNGVSQVSHLGELMFPFVEQVFVSCRFEQRHESHISAFEAVYDAYDFPTPLNGILSAMKTHPKASFLVAAVDMVALDAIAFAKLFALRDASAKVTCFASPVVGGADPLFAIWEGSAFEEMLNVQRIQNIICPRGMIKALGGKVYENAIAPNYLSNANTPADLEAFKLELKHEPLDA